MCSDDSSHNKAILCHQCDLLVSVPKLVEGTKARCPRCHAVLASRWRFHFRQPLIYAISAFMMLMVSFFFSFVGMNISGIENTVSLVDIINQVLSGPYSILLVFFIVFVFLMPLIALITIFMLFTSLNSRLPRELKISLLRLLFQLKTWCMAEIFLTGVLVSFVKLIAYGDISVGLSFLPYCLFCVFLLRAFQCLDKHSLWNYIDSPPKLPDGLKFGETGIKQGIRLCLSCNAILPAQQHQCSRCNAKGHVRRYHSVQWTWALLITSLILYVPANLLPMMTTETLGTQLNSTIMAGVILLWDDGSYPVAMVIFIASIMVPSLKMLAMTWLCLDSKGYGVYDPARMHFIYETVEFVGRWSMIDVFVIIVLTSLVQIKQLMNIFPAVGVVLFAFVVILTMFAAMIFDPRLTWDRSEHKTMMKTVNKQKGAV